MVTAPRPAPPRLPSPRHADPAPRRDATLPHMAHAPGDTLVHAHRRSHVSVRVRVSAAAPKA